MEVEIEVDPSPSSPVRSSAKRILPIIINTPAMTSCATEESPVSESAIPRFTPTDSLSTRERIQEHCTRLEARRRREEIMKRDFERITNSIDGVIHSKYAVFNTKLFMGSFLTAVYLMIYLTSALTSISPKAVKESDPSSVGAGRFISSRAMEHLQDLTNFGPKVTGSYENEYLTVNYLKKELERIKQQAAVEWNEILVDIQIVSGNFTERSNKAGNFLKQTVYQNVQNLVAKLSSKYATESILVNCHFDSFFSTPGTSDDGLNCAVMLEVLRVMSKIDHPLKRNVIFLFNGAEEDGVSGSHGFITEHRWVDDLICFVNLHSTGAGGRQMLFRTGPDSFVLPKIYSKSVPYPNAKVIFEEIFRIGISPSNTDFDNFHKYSKQKLKGLDFAHLGNGYVYHTVNDNISMVTEEDIQLTGDNLLALLQALVNYDNLKEDVQNNDYTATYYDIFGFFVICYPSLIGFLINVAAVFISLYSSMPMLRNVFKGKPLRILIQHVLIDFVIVVVGFQMVTLVLSLLASLLKLNDSTMLWYSHHWFVLTYYGSPVLLVMFLALKIRREFIHSLLNAEQEAKVFIFVIQFIMTVILSLGTLSGIRSSFILAIGLIGVSISHYFLNKTKLKLEMAERKFIMYSIINFVPALYCAYVFIPIVQTMIPMLGCKGANFDNEDIIWIVTEIFVFITFSYFIPLVIMVKEFWTMHYIFTVMYIVQMTYIFAHGLSPFSDSTPERFFALHVDRKLVYGENIFKNETAGYLVTPVDIRGGENILELFKEHEFQQVKYADNCTRELFCGMPSLIPTTPGLIKRNLSYWAVKESPKIPQVKQMNCTLQDDGYEFKTFHLILNGSKFMDAVILPLNGAKLVQWSFSPSVPGDKLKWNGQPAYFIRYHEGSLNQSSLSFSMTFDVLKMFNENDHVFKLSWSVFHLTNTTDGYTPQFKKFIEEFPSWSNVVPMVVEYEEFLLPDLH